MLKRAIISITIFFTSYIVVSAAGLMPTPTFTPTPGGIGSLYNELTTDGNIETIISNGNDLYLGGDFNCIGPRTGLGVTIDPANGLILPGFPMFAAAVQNISVGVQIGRASCRERV